MLTFNLNIIPKVKGAYVVGGSIRDILANRVPNDYDFVVAGSAKDFAYGIAEKTNGHVALLGKPGFTLYRVSSGIGLFDVLSVAGKTIEEDLSKRDFTVNAMAVEVDSGALIDPFNGFKDLKEKKIKMVSEQAFIDDPVRLLRVYRLAAQFNFNIEDQTQKAVKRHCLLIDEPSRERIHSELLGILKTSGSYRYVRLMMHSGLLFAIIPELSVLSGLKPDKGVPEIHSYEKMEAVLANPYLYISGEGRAFNKFDENVGLLKFAVLLTSLLNPEKCTGISDVGNRCFFGSIEVEISMVAAICQSLRFSEDEQGYICHVIKNYQIPGYLFALSQRKASSDRAISRFFYKCKDIVPDIVLFALVSDSSADSRFISFLKQLLIDYYEKFVPLYHLAPLITGQDLISEFPLTPSSGFKAILDQIREARLDGQISSRQEALEMAKRIIS